MSIPTLVHTSFPWVESTETPTEWFRPYKKSSSSLITLKTRIIFQTLIHNLGSSPEGCLPVAGEILPASRTEKTTLLPLPSSLGEKLECQMNGKEMKNLLSLEEQDVKEH